MGGSSFPSQQRGEDVQGFSLLKENDGVDFLLLPSLLKILMVPEITVQATRSQLQHSSRPAPWLPLTTSQPRAAVRCGASRASPLLPTRLRLPAVCSLLFRLEFPGLLGHPGIHLPDGSLSLSEEF